MGKEHTKNKQPHTKDKPSKKKNKGTGLSEKAIFRIMLIVVLLVTSIFLVKNILAKEYQASIIIGGTLLTFFIIIIGMWLKKTDMVKMEFVLSILILFVVFIISINSGVSYSDDFPMYLAVIGLTGLYLKPGFTITQIIISDIMLVIMYLVHPEKAGDLSQYILCFAVFTLAAVLFYLTIRRGSIFIGISEERAKEAESIVSSMREMGRNLEKDFDASSKSIADSTKGLENGSLSISQGADEAVERCELVHGRIQTTEKHIEDLNNEVMTFEATLNHNQDNIEAMNSQLKTVSAVISEADSVFKTMEEKMMEVAKIARELGNISFNTTILSLNASIEAAHAGRFGSGFSVVADEMKNLSENSNQFAEQVSDVVIELLTQVEKTSMQFSESTKAIKESEQTMHELQQGFAQLIEQFDVLYGNIEAQNSNISQVDNIFKELKDKVTEMQTYSADNQNAVGAIVNAMELYKVNINSVIENTKSV